MNHHLAAETITLHTKSTKQSFVVLWVQKPIIKSGVCVIKSACMWMEINACLNYISYRVFITCSQKCYSFDLCTFIYILYLFDFR